MTPTEVQPENIERFSLHQVQAPTLHEQDLLLISLPGCVEFIQAAIELGGRVLVHSISVSRTIIAICAYCKHFFFHSLFSNAPQEGDRMLIFLK